MASRPPWILKAPRVVLVVIFPFLSFLLYLILAIGCINETVSGISPVVVRSAGPINLGGSQVQVDLRIGFWGVCFGPQQAPNCTSSLSINPRREGDLTRGLPLERGGGNLALGNLVIGMQGSFILLSGIPLLIILILSLIANSIQLYFSILGFDKAHATAALWARGLDWAALAGAASSFAAYQSVVASAPRFIRAVANVQVNVTVGTTASNLFGAVVGTTVAGALVNSFLTAQDAGLDAYLAAQKKGKPVEDRRDEEARRLDVIRSKRAAYERFP